MRCAVCGRAIRGFTPYPGQRRAYHARCAARLLAALSTRP